MDTMANDKEKKILKDIAEFQRTIQKLKNKIDAITSWLNSKFDILPDDIKDILSSDDSSYETYENVLKNVLPKERNLPTERITVSSRPAMGKEEGTASSSHDDEECNEIKVEGVKDEIFSDDDFGNDPLGESSPCHSAPENDFNSVSPVEYPCEDYTKLKIIPKSPFTKSLVVLLNDIKKSGDIIKERGLRTVRKRQIPKRKCYQHKINELLGKAESDNILLDQSSISAPTFARFSKSSRVQKSFDENNKDFEVEDDLTDDETLEEHEKKFYCRVRDCGKSFLYQRSFENHTRYAHFDDDKTIDSSDPDYSPSLRRSSKRQVERKVSNNECDILQTEIGRHIRKVKRHLYHCHYTNCRQTFLNKRTLLNHMKSTHPDYEGLPKKRSRGENFAGGFQCSFEGCKKSYYNKGRLNLHQKQENHLPEKIENESNSSKNIADSVQLKCQQCKEEFDDKNKFLSHLETHGDIFRCTFANCNRLFAHTKYKNGHKTQKGHWTEMELKNSQTKCNDDAEYSEEGISKNDEMQSNAFVCPKCGIKGCATRELLNEHILNSCYKCNLCRKPFALNSDRVRHSGTLCNKVRKKKVKKFLKGFENLNCAICLTDFANKINFKDHLAQHTVKLFSCTHFGCKRKLTIEEEMIEHENKLHCKICYTSFQHVAYFKLHNEKEHDGKEEISSIPTKNEARSFTEAFQCPTCGKISESHKSLMGHAERGCQKCNICGRLFTDKSGLDEHIRLHNQDKPFVCSTCGRRFNRNHTLKKHVNAKHSSDKKTYKCMSCDKVYSSMPGYIKHVKVHDEGGIPRIQCTICGFDFVSEASLKKHTAAIHENLRPYPCHLCDKKFKTYSAHKYHVNTHDNPNGRKRSLNKDVDDFHAAAKRRNLNK